MYVLVVFTDENNIAVIPDNWLEGNQCAVWPDNLKGPGRLNKAVKEKIPPEDSWPAYPIRELYRNESFIEVRKRLRKAEEESDLMTTADEIDEHENARKSKRKKRAPLYSDDEEEDREVELRCDKPQHTRDESSDEDSYNSLKEKPKAPKPPRGNFGQKTATFFPSTSGQSTGINQSNTMMARDSRLFTLLEKLIQGQQEMKVMITNMAAAVTTLTANSGSGDGVQDFALPEELQIPIQTNEMMEGAEVLLERKEIFQGLVNYLTLLGGRNVADGTRRALSTVMSNDMATKYNWHGLKGKQSFGKLKLCAAVQKAVLKSCKCYASEFEKECREWLRTASDRDGGRKRRKNTPDVNDDRNS